MSFSQFFLNISVLNKCFCLTRLTECHANPCPWPDIRQAYRKKLFFISDWFIVLFAPVVIGQSDYFGIGFSTVI